ncbi:restriction endonuclease subunit S [Acetivibrio clariflavus]|uniref:restriction endonuclease subunit S n=1 Tax=Acetivibrio clariflavus TaxID=288965 RepID=UPI0004B701AB|nr:restriction endonuclease subunit S [Acetivibrio clariflavus]
MTKWNNVSLGELLTESNIPSENPDPSKRITVRLNVEGIEKRPFREETKGATKYYIRKAGQFIYGKQNLHKGAFGIIPEELDGYESTIDLPAFDIDKSKVLPEWLMLILTKDNFYKELESIASGSATKRIHPERLFQVKIPLPSISEQKDILKKYDMYKVYHTAISNIIDDARIYIDKLRQSILQEAVQGKLVPQDPNDEPASVLLERIKEEKERLIKEGKIKKEKPLPPISEDEIPYELPEGWEWVRLGEIAIINPRNDIDDDVEVSFIPMKLIEDGFSNKHTSEIKKWKDVKNGFTHFQEGDVVIAKITPCFQNRKSAVMRNLKNGYGAGTTELYVVRTYANTVLPEYLLALFKTEAFIKGGVATYTGTAGQQRVKKDYIENLLLPLPPLNEQKRIVEKVDQLMALCDELEKNIEQSKKDCELLIQSVLQEAFKEA